MHLASWYAEAGLNSIPRVHLVFGRRFCWKEELAGCVHNDANIVCIPARFISHTYSA